MSGPARSPGWALDVVLAAAAAAGLKAHSFNVHLHADGTTREVTAHLARKNVAAGVELLAALGAVAQVSKPYGPPNQPQVNVDGAVPVLGGVQVGCIATEGLPTGDGPDSLAAAVDAARAGAPSPSAVIQGGPDARLEAIRSAVREEITAYAALAELGAQGPARELLARVDDALGGAQ